MAKRQDSGGRAPEQRAAGPRSRPGPRPGSDRRDRPPRPEALPPDTILLWGLHSVAEAIEARRRKPLRLFATPAAAERAASLAGERGIPLEIVSPDVLAARLPRDAVHQGLLLEARPLPRPMLEDLPGAGIVLVLDQVTDPHNVGAILRTAAAFAVEAVITTDRHAPDLSGTLAKAASGGLEHVPVILVVNLARALDDLGDQGFLRVGLDSAGESDLAALPLSRPLALVLGSEGRGLRRLTRERCDIVARLDMPGAIKSLNVSNACAVALTVATLRTSESASAQ